MSVTGSFSIISTNPDVDTLYTPSFTEDSIDDGASALDISSGPEADDVCSYPDIEIASHASTPVMPSAYRYEHHLGRRYHSFRSGRYPLPNDSREQQLEELQHHLMLEVTVRSDPRPFPHAGTEEDYHADT